MATTDDNSRKALGADLVSQLYKLNGAGLKIGVISDSFNRLGGAAADTASGDLPATVTVLSDDTTSGTDEGRAMIELAYRVAPGASFLFASGGNSIQSIADAVTALRAAGADIIVDDLGYGTAEGLYQVGTALDNAITAAVNGGADYVSAAGNDGKSYFEGGFKPITIPDGGTSEVVNDFGGGNPYLSLTIANGRAVNFQFGWAQPFASINNGPGAANSLAIALFDADGNLVAGANQSRLGGDPAQAFTFTNTTGGTAFKLAVVQNGGTVPAGQLFKLLFPNGGVTINDPNANTGSGNIFGHELLSDQASVGAIDYKSTPAFGSSPATVTGFSSVGPGTILFDAAGKPLAQPVTVGEPNFAAPQGSGTAVPGFAPFDGTSAAAPNTAAVEALMLQANRSLTPAEVLALLTQSTIPVASELPDGGAGLIQARAAVELAAAAAGARWTGAAGGKWGDAASWSGHAVPTAAGAAMVGNAMGAIGGDYTLVVDTANNDAGSLSVNGSGQHTTLSIASGGALGVGGPAANDPTAGDLLVAANGTLQVAGGTLSVAGSLNTNNGTVSISSGGATADNYAQTAGALSVGGGNGAASLVLTGGGLVEIGGGVSVSGHGSIATTGVSVSSASFGVAAGGSVHASGESDFTSNSIFSDAGSFVTAAGLLFDSAIATVLSGGMLQAGSLLLSALTGGLASTLTVAGSVTIGGALGAGAAGLGQVRLQSGGTVSIGASAANAGIDLSGGGTLDFGSSDSAVLLNQLTSVLSGFGNGSGSVDFTGLTYDPTDVATYSSGRLTLTRGATDTALAALSLDPADGYTLFAVTPDAGNHVLVKAVPCYCHGTLIRTARGDVAVEALEIGDLVLTAQNGLRPIRWLGRRSYAGRFIAGNPEVLPVLFRAGSLADGIPARDLSVSPLHAMFIDGLLVPAGALVDGRSVVQRRGVERVDYVHVELDSHDVIFAEGAPSETFVDDGGRGLFNNAGEFGRLYPAAPVTDAIYCAPRVEQGAALEAIRNRLAARAADAAGRQARAA